MSVNNEFKNFLSGIQNELTDKTYKKYYKSALKDLTQTERVNFLKICKGDLDPNSPEARAIMTALENYKKAYDDSGQNPKLSITARGRKDSIGKSIKRSFTFKRTTSDKVLKALMKTDLKSLVNADHPVMASWIERFKDNFLAHAIFTHADKVLNGGVLKPAEMMLRENRNVEFEQGTTYGQRGTTRLPQLSGLELQSLQKVLFTDEDRARLDEIEQDPSLEAGKNKYKEFSALRKELHHAEPLNPFDAPTLRPEKMHRSGELLTSIRNKSDPEINLYLEYAALKRKEHGLRALFMMKDKQAEYMTGPREDVTTKMHANSLIDHLADKNHCTRREILIAFDQAQPPEKQTDSYLRKKFNKGLYSENTLANLRTDVLNIQKLNPEIRMSDNKIFWAYGDVVILMGGDKSNVRIKEGNEALMSSPIKGEDFFTINLETVDNLLILGPKKKLEAFKEKYGEKIVYIEDLSLAQMETLDIPKDLR